jgi:hypothetical protein
MGGSFIFLCILVGKYDMIRKMKGGAFFADIIACPGSIPGNG